MIVIILIKIIINNHHDPVCAGPWVLHDGKQRGDQQLQRHPSRDGKVMMIIMVTQQIPHMTKSHHGGNMSLIGEVGFCHRHIPTIDNYDDEVGLGVFVDL